uniref:Uncharacterized protein n=1 Tax=Caenorhabditis japonica TaxID=281687 RepID=A0A8R1DYP8_CAEJA
MSYDDSNPSFEELMEVVQRQQEVIELFEQQVEACRMESLKLAEEGQKKSEIIEILENSEALMKAEMEQLKIECEKRRNGEAEEKEDVGELETVGELRIKCKELNYELERLKTRQSTLEIDLGTEKRNHEFVESELEEEKRQRAEEKKRLTQNLETLEKEMKDQWKEQQETLSTQQIKIAQLKTHVEIKEQREKQLERHYQDIMEEMTEIRREKAKAMGKNTGMAAENAELKSRIQQLKARLPRNEHEIEDMQKLLGDQSHLIAALREETKLLARKLEIDSKQHRSIFLYHGIQYLKSVRS